MVDAFAIRPELAKPLPDDGRGSVVTVGTFDGVHRGHLAVFDEICRRAREGGRRSVLVTFDPHPLRIVRPEHAPALLTTPEEKTEILAETPLDYLVFVPFTKTLSLYPPERFVHEILVGRLGVSELVIGYDHGFGKGRSGDVDTLRTLGGQLGFSVDVVPPVMGGDDAVSSTRIRRAVAGADLEGARRGLGRPYSARGVVVRGDGRGRTLGFPTANLSIPSADKLLPPPGIYAVWVQVRTGTFSAALHMGPRPTFPGAGPAIEAHLLDFDGNLYGENLRIDFMAKLRDVAPFGSVADLIAQMRKDTDEARRVLEHP